MPVSPPNGRSQTTSEHLVDWVAERDAFVAQLNRDGTWRPMFGPMLEEVAQALRMAGTLREAAERELFVKSARSGRSYIHPGIAAADVEVRRAALLLSRMASMAKPSAALEDSAEEEDPFAELDAGTRYSHDPLEDARIRREMDERQRVALSKGRRK